MGKKAKGSNSHGYTNEEKMVKELDGKKINELNTNLKKLIKDIATDSNIELKESSTIKAKIEKNNKLKQDFYINIEGNEFGISTKMGNGNSVHQEKVEEFITWLENLGAKNLTDIVKNDLKLLIWADGTIDGKGAIEKDIKGIIVGRFNIKRFKKIYPKKIELIQGFMTINSEIILNRVIFEGKHSSKVDYIYHGNPLSGTWLSKKDVLDFHINNPKIKDKKNTSTLSVGRLTVQAWNVSLEGNTEKKRGQIQLKYGCMVKDFEKLMFSKATNIGLYEGDKEEFRISQYMNKDKNHKFWKVLSKGCNLDNTRDNYYVVKVEGNKKSKLSGKKTKCKTDNFLIRANITKEYLLEHEYQLNENMLNEIGDYEVINNSGISVKRIDSKKYTIVKLTVNSFKEAFNEYIPNIDYITAALILYTKKNLNLNPKIMMDLNLNQDEFKQFFSKKHKINGTSIDDQSYVSKVNRMAKDIVMGVIESNPKLKMALFTGEGWFDSPYYTNYIFKNGELTNEVYTNYTISNGSGKSKGDYTIILKPKN